MEIGRRRPHIMIMLIIGMMLVVLVLIVFLRPFKSLSPKQVRVISEDIRVNPSGEHLSNHFQQNASVWLNVIENRLYCVPQSKTSANKCIFDNSLIVFKNGTAQKIHDLQENTDNIVIVGEANEYLYYWGSVSDLYCCNCLTKEDYLLYSGLIEVSSSIWYSADGSLFIPLRPTFQEQAQFLHVSGTDVLGQELQNAGLSCGDYTYHVVYEYGDDVERIIRTDKEGNEDTLHFNRAMHRYMIPVENGILVHNVGSSDMLYLIESDGCVQLLFSLPCISSRSCVTVIGNKVLLSVLRFEKYGEIGMKRFENDTEEGTYCIDLAENTVTKISSNIYDGMYNFDDSCIFACDDNCNIYKLDPNGKLEHVIMQVIEP